MIDNNSGYGVVYTPKELADFVAELLLKEYKHDMLQENKDAILALDPACGEGALLCAVDRASKYSFASKKFSLLGIDIDADVIKNNANRFDVSKYAFFCQDALLPSGNQSPRSYWHTQGIVPDIIIANPPWSAEKIYSKEVLSQAGYKFDNGQYDCYTLFIELSLSLLQNGGYAAFIIPDSLFSSENRELRKYLSENLQLRVIARMGEKLFPGIFRATTVLVLKKDEPNESSETRCFRLSTDQRNAFLSGAISLSECYELCAHTVKQSRFSNNPRYVFDIDAHASEESLLKKIEMGSIKWEKLFRFGRGVEISKSGKVVMCPCCGVAQGYSKKQFSEGKKICTKCDSEIPISGEITQSIVSHEWQPGYKKIYVGENLHRYEVNGYCYVRLNVHGINYKEEKLYEPPKILVRKTGLGINACVDYESTYITQTVYSCNYIDSECSIPLEYFLGVLNSRVVYYYYLKKYGENEWKSHPYFTKDILFSLPIPCVNSENAKTCELIAEQVKSMQGEYNRRKDLAIERLVFELYKLNNEEKELIIQEMNCLPDLSAINHMKISGEDKCLDI